MATYKRVDIESISEEVLDMLLDIRSYISMHTDDYDIIRINAEPTEKQFLLSTGSIEALNLVYGYVCSRYDQIRANM